MDQGSNQTLVVDVISVVTSFANLNLSPSPFNRLPNEILLKILSKVERMVPIQKFARLRSVDTRLRSVVDDICNNKKSLLVIIGEKDSSTTLQVEHLFFGLWKEAAFTRVDIKSSSIYDGYYDSFTVVNDNIFQFLLKALPNIEQLYIYGRNTTGIGIYQLYRRIAKYINSLSSLKQLFLNGSFRSIFNHFERLQNPLPRLEFIFYYAHKHTFYSDNHFVRCVSINFDYVRQLHARNPRWLDNVTQLSLTVGLNDQFDQVGPFLGEHATGLNVLYIKFCDITQITSELFGHLGKLTQLREIALGPIQFELLKQAAKAIELNQFTPLSTITTCHLVFTDFDSRSVTVTEFARVLVAIFPSVVSWKFAFVPMALDSFLIQIEQNSNFITYLPHPNIRECKFIEKTVDGFFDLLNYNPSQYI